NQRSRHWLSGSRSASSRSSRHAGPSQAQPAETPLQSTPARVIITPSCFRRRCAPESGGRLLPVDCDLLGIVDHASRSIDGWDLQDKEISRYNRACLSRQRGG